MKRRCAMICLFYLMHKWHYIPTKRLLSKQRCRKRKLPSPIQTINNQTSLPIDQSIVAMEMQQVTHLSITPHSNYICMENKQATLCAKMTWHLKHSIKNICNILENLYVYTYNKAWFCFLVSETICCPSGSIL